VRRAQVRDGLLDAVARLLAGGATFATVSVNEMVAEAGVAKSTFYQYFTSKNDVLGSFVAGLMPEAGIQFAWPAAQAPLSAAPLAQGIRDQLTAHRRHLPLLAAAFETAYVDAEVRQSVERFSAMLEDGLRIHIQAGQAAGWIDASLPTRGTARWLNWMLCRGVQQLICSADGEATDALVVELSRMLWEALYAYPLPSRPISTA
jgi:AcrR family transcriptional regulator